MGTDNRSASTPKELPETPQLFRAGSSAVLSVELTAALARYQRALARAPLAAASRAKYTARGRGFLAWLDTAGRDPDLDGDRLTDPGARDGAG